MAKTPTKKRNLNPAPVVPKPYDPKKEEAEIREHLLKRIPVLKDSRKKILGNIDFDSIMKEADREYQPHELTRNAPQRQSQYIEMDEVNGFRGARIVPLGTTGKAWRSSISEPTLFVKINTAISILINQYPDAKFKGATDKYKSTADIAKAIWRRSWNLADSRDQLKLFVHDLAKYGWAIGRTYPRLVEHKKSILTELDLDKPENNQYREVTITDFNDIYRETLDPHRTWIDDMTNLRDPWSMNDWYFEKDYSRDVFEREFGQYSNSDKITFGQPYRTGEDEEADDQNEQTKERDDVATVGFYENYEKDLYALWIPKDDVVLYHSPLPNDEGKLSCWWTYWTERDARTPYGIGLYEMIKNDKVLYDRLENMTMDQLTLSIYSMFFYSGTQTQQNDGAITVSPGKFIPKLPGTTIEQMKVNFDPAAWQGIEYMSERIDEITGVTKTLQGEVEGKTLGEVLHAKDSALKRLNIPLDNIGSCIEKDAFLTLSWASQVYALPEVKEFTTLEDLQGYIIESGRDPSRVADQNGAFVVDFPQQLDLTLETTRDGQTLVEKPENRLFTVGTDIPTSALNWRGKITVTRQSIIAPSPELERQRKMELFNMIFPSVVQMVQFITMGQHRAALGIAHPAVEILEIQDEKPEKWLPREVVEMLKNPDLAAELEAQAMMQMQSGEPLMMDGNNNGMPTAPGSQGPSSQGLVPKDDIKNPLKGSLEGVKSQPLMK